MDVQNGSWKVSAIVVVLVNVIGKEVETRQILSGDSLYTINQLINQPAKKFRDTKSIAMKIVIFKHRSVLIQ